MTSTVAVKICGLTRIDDAQLAASLGAHAVGFVLAEGSPRRITIDDAARMAAGLPAGVRRVGVFVNSTRDVVAAAQAAVSFDVLQLHGDERVEDFAGLAARVVKVVRLASAADVERAAVWPAGVTPLVDSGTPAMRGGTGQTAEWDLAAALARRRPIWLAGGLTPENVSEAIRRVRPALVDVSSGVESAPGEKDADRLRAFFGAVHRAGQEGA